PFLESFYEPAKIHGIRLRITDTGVHFIDHGRYSLGLPKQLPYNRTRVSERGVLTKLILGKFANLFQRRVLTHRRQPPLLNRIHGHTCHLGCVLRREQPVFPESSRQEVTQRAEYSRCEEIVRLPTLQFTAALLDPTVP